MSKSKPKNLGFYATEEITNYEWLAMEYPFYYGFYAEYSDKEDGFQLFAYMIN